MENFEYQRVTNLIFGKDNIDKLGLEIKKYTNKTILFTYGGGSIKKNGLYNQIINEFNKHNIKFIELSGIKPNPEVDTAQKGADLIKDNDIDFILAVGGGSVLDNSKHMSIASKSDKGVWDLVCNPSEVGKLNNLPKIGTIITIAATGSEMNFGGVLSNPETNQKLVMFHKETTPVFTFEDPTMLFTLPLKQKQAGVSDMMSHLLEVYFGSHNDDKLTDRIVEAIFKNVVDNFEIYLKNNDNYDVHGDIFLSATLALNGLTTLGRKYQDWTSHTIEHEVSAYTDLTHGIGLAIIQPVVLRYYYETDLNEEKDLTKFVNFGKNVFEFQGTNEEIAKKTIDKIEHLFYKVTNVKTLKDVGINNFLAIQSVDKIFAHGLGGQYQKLGKEDLLTIFKRIS